MLRQVSETDSVIYYTYTQNSPKSFYRGQKRYELSNHLGNVLAVITDRRIQACGAGDVMHYEAQVVSVSDYYPFGMGIKEREWKDSSFSYRYGFNGQEMDDEVSGEGNSYDYGARIYDSRLMRFVSIDPMQDHPKLIGLSPYQFAYNSPVSYIDEDGEFPLLVITGAIGAIGNVAIGLYKGERNAADLLQRAAVGFAVGAGAGLLTAGAAAVAGGVTLSTAAGFTVAETAAVLGGGGLAQVSMIGGAFSSGAENLLDQGIDILRGKRDEVSVDDVLINVLVGYGSGALSGPGGISKEAIKKGIINSVDDKLVQLGIEGVKERTKKKAIREATKFVEKHGTDYALEFRVTVDNTIEFVAGFHFGIIEEHVTEDLKEVVTPKSNDEE